jgi:hypothetical protein
MAILLWGNSPRLRAISPNGKKRFREMLAQIDGRREAKPKGGFRAHSGFLSPLKRAGVPAAGIEATSFER